MSQNTITLFNWSELLLYGRKDLAAIICLLYAQTVEYNELSSKTMMYRLKLKYIPRHVFSINAFEQFKHTLYCHYKTKEPLSYIRNSSFLYDDESVKIKATYLKALSMRSISNKNSYIPRHYYPTVETNRYLTVLSDTIHFNLEK